MANLAETMRPKTFDEVIGNEHITAALKQQFSSGTLSQTIMFIGSPGSGKTTYSRIIASELNAEVHEINCATDTGIDNVREIVEASQLSSLFASSKVFILDEVHGLSKQAQSGLLKTLEDHQPNTYFILLTTEKQKILKTILTRCVIYETKPATNKEIGVAVNRVLDKYNLQVENRQDFWSVIHASEGSLRAVYASMEKLLAVVGEGGTLTTELFSQAFFAAPEETDENLPKAFLDKDITAVMEYIKEGRKELNPVSTTIGLYNYLRVVYLRSGKGNKALLADLAELLSHKRVEWEHLEWLAWKHL